METDEDQEPGSSSQSQNLHDLQNYLVTFNKDIGSGDDVLPNMDVDTGVGDVGDLYGTTSENSLHESGDTGVSAQFSSGFYSEQGILDGTLTDEPGNQIQNLVASAGADADSEMSEIKQEIRGIDLEGVPTQIAGFGDTQLSIPGIQDSTLSQSLIMTPLGDSVMTNQGKVVRIMSLAGEEGQYVSLADGQQMQIINSEDLGLTALESADGSLDINSQANSILRSSNADSPISLASLSTNTGDLISSSGMAMAPGHGNGTNTALVTTTANTGAALLNPGLGPLVALQGTGEGGQPQLVSLQGDPLHSDALQIPGVLGGEGLGSDLAYQTITIMPSDIAQHGEMNYVLILSQPDGEKETMASVAQVYDLKQEAQDFPEDAVDDSCDTKQVLRFVQKKMMTQLGSQQLMCAFCNYTSPKRYLLTRHMRSHSDERPFKCDSCDRGFKTSASLLNHVNTHTGTRPHKCKTCESAFTTSGELVRHIRYRHTFEKPHRCPECDYASVELSKLKRHMRSHTGERPYKCPNCPYASPDTYKLKRHMRIHTGEKPYECDHCHARFTQSNSLKAHKLIHSGNKPVYQCSLCPTTCGRKTDLKIHFNKLHSTGSPLECRKCGKSYSDRYSYKQHLRTHDIDKCYKCEHCDFIAANEKSLEAHNLVNCGKFRCDECNASFSNQKHYDKHMTMLHPSGLAAKKQDCDNKAISISDREGQGSSASSSLYKGGHGGTLEEMSVATNVITPLASNTLHKNLIQDIKEGKLGDVPQVVIVHPDGSQEEISSKYGVNEKWTLVDEFHPVASSDPSATESENTSAMRAADITITIPGHALSGETTGEEPASSDNKKDESLTVNSEEEGLYNQSELSQHCEAATQVEIESDVDSSSDASPQASPKDNNSSQHLTKAVQENIDSLFNLDSSLKSSSMAPDISPFLKTPSSNSNNPLYLKTFVTKPSSKKLISFSSSHSHAPSPALKTAQASSSINSLELGQPSKIDEVRDGITNVKALDSLGGDRTSKTYVSLGDISGGGSSEPPIQLLAGDLNFSLPLVTESGQGDSGHDSMLEDDDSEMPSSSLPSALIEKAMELEPEVKSVETQKSLIQSGAKETSYSDHDSDKKYENNGSFCANAEFLSSNQNVVQNTRPGSEPVSSLTNFPPEVDLAMNLDSINSQDKKRDNCGVTHSRNSSSPVWDQGPPLSELPQSSTSVDNPPIQVVDQESQLDLKSDKSLCFQISTAHCENSVSKKTPHSSIDSVFISDMDAIDLDPSKTSNDCDNPRRLTSSCPIQSVDTVLSCSTQSSLITSTTTSNPVVDGANGDLPSKVSNKGTISLLPDISQKSSDKGLSNVTVESPKVIEKEGPHSKSKSKGKWSKRRSEPDQTLVMTGKRLRKALVKVSM